MNIDRQVDVSRDYQRLEGSLRGRLNLGITAGRWNAPYPLVNNRNAGSPIDHALYTRATLRFSAQLSCILSSFVLQKVPKLSRTIPS
jgi:hypothetical protein